MSTSVASSTAAAAGTLGQQQHHQRQVFNWLDDLNLTHLFDKFIEHGYEDLDLCMKIGESDLNAIGIQDLRERIALLQAVRQLQHELQQLHLHQQQQQSSGIAGGGVASGKGSVVPSSFLKVLSPTRRKIPGDVLIAGGGSSAPSRPSSRLGGAGTWGHHNSQSEEVELQEIRRYHHFQQTHSPSATHAPSSPQSASTALSSFFHQQQQQQNTFNELIHHHQRRSNGGGGNGLEHQHQQSLLLLGRRTLPLHQQHLAGRDYPSADDIHDGPDDGDDDDDNGDYSECTDFDLILSAQRACSSSINHNNNIHHLQQLHLGGGGVNSREQGGGGVGLGIIPPVFLEQCSCDCGLFAEDGRPVCRNPHLHFQQRNGIIGSAEDDEPFYESVSPQPPHQQTPHRQRHPSSSNNKKHHLQQNHVNYPVPPLPLNYGGGGGGKLQDQNNSGSGSSSNTTTSTSGCVVDDNNSSSTGASSVVSANSSSSASHNGTHSQPNFIILRSQLRDQIIQDGINFSRALSWTNGRGEAARASQS